MEIVLLPLFTSVEGIVNAAIQENVDIIGISSLSGAHLQAVGDIIQCFKEKGVKPVPLICGGIIPEEDKPALRELGIKGMFGPGTPIESIVDIIKGLIYETGNRAF